MATYDQLVNKSGTIYNTQDATGYSSPDQLAADLGVSANQIQWGNIKSDPNYNPTLTYNVGGQQASQTIGTDQLKPATAVTVPTQNHDATISNANSLASGVSTTNKSLQDYIDSFTPPETAADKAQKTILDSI